MEPLSQVRAINNPTREGIYTGKVRERKGKRLLQVQFPDQKIWINEDQLELVPGEREDPLELLQLGKFGGSSDLRRTLTHVKLSGRLADIIYSMEVTNTDFYAYQFKPVIKVLQSPTNGLLVADEVGLGKTIEAGLIWTELRSRFDLRRLLVLCPATLREKWCRELSLKLGVTADVCDASEALNTLRNADSSLDGFAMVCSLQGLRPNRNWDEPKNRSPRNELARFLQEREYEDHLVDLLIVDEAHHMKNPSAQTHQLGQLFRAVSEYILFLTATPIHNRRQDLYSLLNLLDPDTFARKDQFIDILEANRPLVTAREMVLSGKADKESLLKQLFEALSNPLLKENRQLQSLLASEIDDESLTNPEMRSRLAHRLETVNLLGHTVTRTRKRDVQDWRVIREPNANFVEMHPSERHFYDLVTDIVTNYAIQRGVNEVFILSTPQRQMASCMPAALHTWQMKLNAIDESYQDETTLSSDQLNFEMGPLVSILVEKSREFGDFETLKKVDTKYNSLRSILLNHFKEYPEDKLIIFSTFRPTLAYLNSRLCEDGIDSIILQGGGDRTKDDVIQEFQDPHGPKVLLSSEVGGEGVDLQFCWVLINYDLPWNPMKLEQRIGRIDRLGQQSEKVFIWNLFFNNTIDSRIYEKLYMKLNLCKEALGDFEDVLGEKISELTRDLLTQRLTPKQQELRIEQTAQALENLKLEEERLESEAANLVAYGDYILNQVQAARDLHRWVDGEDIRRYTTDFFNTHFTGCSFREIDPDKSLFEVRLSTEAKYQLEQFIRQNNLAYPTRLTLNDPKPIRCVFVNQVSDRPKAGVETISQFHPMVRFVSKKIKELEQQLRPAVSVTLDTNLPECDIEKGTYLLAASLWSIQGIRASEKLVYAAVKLSTPTKLLPKTIAEKIANLAAVHGKTWHEVRSKIDPNEAFEIANEELFGNLDEEFEAFYEEEKAYNNDRADIQEKNLKHHLQSQREKLLGLRNNYQNDNRINLVKLTNGRIKALEERFERQLFKINETRNVKGENNPVFVAIVDLCSS